MIPYFPAVDATLNAACAIFLMLGFFFVREKNIRAHKTCMLSAFATSMVFLVCYLTYHYFHGTTHFLGKGVVRNFYFVLLVSYRWHSPRYTAPGASASSSTSESPAGPCPFGFTSR
jgi:putative membrane protein